MNQDSEKSGGLSANVLKIIAVITMFIDHFTVIFLMPALYGRGTGLFSSFSAEEIQTLYSVGRGIGRIAFPIFAFFVAEGLFYTKDRRRYLERLFLFALISEIPFDYSLFGMPFYSGASNVIFTLFLGGVAIYLGDLVLGRKVVMAADGRRALKKDAKSNANNMPVPLRIIITILIYLGAMYLGQYFLTDYSFSGVLVILVDYLFMYELRSVSGYSDRAGRIMGFSLGIIVLSLFSSRTELYAAIDLIFIALYSGKRGKQYKYFFYIFYPAHLVLLKILFQFMQK